MAVFRGERTTDKSRLLDSPALHPELRARPEACQALDRVFAEAMSPSPDRRPQSAEVLAAGMLGAIQLGGRVLAAVAPAPSRWKPPSRASAAERYQWSVVARPRADLAVRSVAWTGDGRALAATDRGLAFWDATRWTEALRPNHATGVARWVRSMGAGEWLVGGDRPMLQRFDGAALVDLFEAPVEATRAGLRAHDASGDIEDLAVFVFAADRAAVAPALFALVGGRWLAPLPLEDVEGVTAVARISDRRWLLGGRARDGGGYLGVYEPLSFRVERLPTPRSPTFLAAAGSPERGVGIACGLSGSVAWYDGTQLVPASPLHESVPLAAASIDRNGRVWVASVGAIFCASAHASQAGHTEWHRVWSDPRFQAPFGSIYADDDRVLAMTVDGGVVEGRVESLP